MGVGLRRAGVVVSLLAMVVFWLAACGTPTKQWQMLGPGSATVNVLASDPHIRGILYAGDTSGVTYVARGDRSGQFLASTKSPGRFAISVIFPNPYTSGAVYAGNAGGFYASSDYGLDYTAQNSGLPSGANVTAITSGADASTLFAFVEGSGLYTSADAGKAWQAVVPSPASATNTPLPASANVQSLFWDSAAKALYATVTGSGNGIYVSTDGGVNWKTDNNGLPAKPDVYQLLTLASGGLAQSGPTLYAATSYGVFARATTDANWKIASAGLPGGAVVSLATYPGTAGLLYAGTRKTVYSSTDGGRNWQKVADGLTHSVPAIVVVPGQNTPMVTFVASGQIARYPGSAAGSGGIFSTILLLLIVVLLVWYILGRYKIVPSMTEVRRRLTRRGSSTPLPR